MDGDPGNRDGEAPAGGIVHHSRYNYLRNHLTRLGYSAHLPHDGVDLCEAIFLDLVDLTRRFRDLKLKDKKNVYELQQMEAKAKNMRQENSSLMEKMNKLYLDKMKGESDVHHGRSFEEKNELQGYEHRISQLNHRLKESEAENEKLKRQLDKVYKNRGVFVSHAKPMVRDEPVARGQSIEQIGKAGTAQQLPVFSLGTDKNSGETEDLRKELEKISLSQREILLQEEAREKELQSLRNNIKDRDREIERLSKLCHNDENFEQLNRKLADKSTRETNEFLNKKVDFLNMELGKAEKELEKLLQKDRQIERLAEEKETIEGKLSNSLKEIDRLRDEVDELRLRTKKQKDDKSRTKLNNLRYMRTNTNSPKSKTMHMKFRKLTEEMTALREENEELSKVYQDYQKDKKNLTEVLQQRDGDISRYRAEIQSLKENLEKALKDLIEAQSTKQSALQKAKACEKDVGFHQKNVQQLVSKHRDKATEVQRLQRELNDSKAAAKRYLENNLELQRRLETLELQQKTTGEELMALQNKELDTSRSNRMLVKKKDALLKRIHDSEMHMDTLRKEMSKKCNEQQKESERAEFLQAEISTIKDKFISAEDHISHLEVENHKLKTEREKLKDQLEDMSREVNRRKSEELLFGKKLDNIANYQSKIKQLEQEVRVLEVKDRQCAEELLTLRNLLARKEGQRKEREVGLQRANDEVIALTRLVKEKEREIQDLRENLQLWKTDRACNQKQTQELQTRLIESERLFTESQTKLDQMTLDVRKKDLDMNDLRQQLALIEKKFQDQKDISVNCEFTLKKLEEDIKRQREDNERAQGRIRTMEEELGKKQNDITRAKDDKHIADLRISEVSRDLAEAENELRKTSQLVKNQQSMIAKMDGGIGISNQEIVRCRKEITYFRSSLEEKEEIISKMKVEYTELLQNFTSKKSVIEDLEQVLADKKTCIKQAETQRIELEEQVIGLAKDQETLEEELELWKEGHRKISEYNLVWKKSYENVKSELVQVSAENVEKTQEVDGLRIQYNQLQKDLAELQEDYEKLQWVDKKEASINSDLRKQLQQLKNQLLVSKETQRIVCDKEMSLNDVIRERNRELEILKNRSNAESFELVTLRSEAENLTRAVGQKDCQIIKLEEQLEKLMTETQKLNRENSQESRYIVDLKTMLTLEKENVSRLNADIRALQLQVSEQMQDMKEKERRLQAVLSEMEQLNDKLAHNEEAFINLERKLEKEKNKCRDNLDQIKNLELDKTTYQNKIDLLNEDLNVERVKFQDLQNSHNRLNQRVQIMQRYRPINSY